MNLSHKEIERGIKITEEFASLFELISKWAVRIDYYNNKNEFP